MEFKESQQPTYEGLKRSLEAALGQINSGQQPTYEGLKQMFISVSVSTTAGQQPTYEGLKLWHYVKLSQLWAWLVAYL